MAIQFTPTTEAAPSFFTSDALQEITYNVSLLITNPFINLAYYFIPSLSKLSSYDRQLDIQDISLRRWIQDGSKQELLDEIRELQNHAGLQKYKIHSYCTMDNAVDARGGLWSIGDPLINIPGDFLTPPENLEDIWHFSREELHFFIARAMSYIQNNHSLARTLIKVVLLAATVFPLFTTLTLSSKIAIGVISLALYVYNERTFESRLDKLALKVLEKKYPSKNKAKEIALGALRKLQKQTQTLLKERSARRFFLSEDGNHFLRINKPLLTTRIQKLEQKL